jgi:hypothetical protein
LSYCIFEDCEAASRGKGELAREAAYRSPSPAGKYLPVEGELTDMEEATGKSWYLDRVCKPKTHSALGNCPGGIFNDRTTNELPERV